MLVFHAPRRLRKLTHAVDIASHPEHTDSVGTLERRSRRIVEHHQPAAVVGTAQVDLRLAGTRSVAAAVHPSAAASCHAGHTDLVDLAVVLGPDRSEQLLAVRVPLLASVHCRLPSSSPSTLCESL